MSSKRTQEQRSGETVARVLEVAERHFAAYGFEATSTEALVAEAGLTRGALYHHFGSKLGLFEAVVGAVQARLAVVIAARVVASEPYEALLRGSEAWLEVATDPAVQRILLLDAPSVLGWERWLELDERGGGRLLREAVGALAGEALVSTNLEALTQFLNGALNQLALWVAAAENRGEALASAKGVLRQVLLGLQAQKQ